jgi:hypothetical protein
VKFNFVGAFTLRPALSLNSESESPLKAPNPGTQQIQPTNPQLSLPIFFFSLKSSNPRRGGVLPTCRKSFGVIGALWHIRLSKFNAYNAITPSPGPFRPIAYCTHPIPYLDPPPQYTGPPPIRFDSPGPLLSPSSTSSNFPSLFIIGSLNFLTRPLTPSSFSSFFFIEITITYDTLCRPPVIARRDSPVLHGSLPMRDLTPSRKPAPDWPVGPSPTNAIPPNLAPALSADAL